MLFEFVRATELDKEYLLKLRKKTMTEHLENTGQFLSEEEHIDRLNHQYKHSYLVFFAHAKIGMVKYHSNAKELELVQVQIDTQYQAKGYGTAVIKQVMNSAKDKTINLTVLKSNPAVGLYKKLGFSTVGEDNYEYHMQKEH